MPTDASAQRLRVGAELRRLRLQAQLSGEFVANAFGWAQSKVSRMETGRTAFTVKDVAGLLALYGVPDDVRAELLGATAEDTGEGAWIVRAGGFPRRQGSISQLESTAKRIRHHQPVVLPGLLQTYDYARAVISAAGATDPDSIAAARMKRQEMLTAPNAPKYEVVLDARALLLGVADVDLIRAQIRSLAERVASLKSLDFRIIPFGKVSPVFTTVGFTLYEFKEPTSPAVAWVETPTGDVYFSAREDTDRYSSLFQKLQSVALPQSHAVRYLQSLEHDIERYLTGPDLGGI
ncbi:helix-turn-helix domain-containing protein [Actinoplanes couchii]|uniref:Transcriptional regulator n=1 Tax=Actinoplanes couchii TaxID=403638 RepID=A0ABQ3XQ59_9ACTN|nr:helix-turn-helix transcriptional regulator [Actinoplanes couchii]MDR6322968.1 transcriptional regulator with XRE-family HTH domain [Actinoplanes couchii]GID60642.1 transcriptional regulator [Actinoplanes couchii]